MEKKEKYPLQKSEEDWKKELTPEQYHILREKGTERPGSGIYNETKEKGVYVCAACGNELFTSDTKYESSCGWPSFFQPVGKENVEEAPDNSFFMHRTEIKCARCGSHLGHVFEDGPKPTGLRYCINSAALKLKTEQDGK